MNSSLRSVVWVAVVIGAAWGCLPSGVPNNCDCAAAPSCGGCVSSAGSSYSAYSRDSNSIQQPVYPQYSNSYAAPAPVAPYPRGPAPPDSYQPPPLAFDINELNENNAGNYINPNPTLITSVPAYSTPAPAESYPAEQYQQMLGVAPSSVVPKVNPQSAPQTTPPTAPAQSETASQPPRKPTNTDGTAYREAYRVESVAHFESSDVTAPPPEDLEADYADGSTTMPPGFPVPPMNDSEYAAVVKEITEEKESANNSVTKSITDNFLTYTQQVCTGVVISKAIAGSMLDVAMKCAEVGCTAANVRATEDDVFEAIFLQRADNRKDNAEFNCISTETVPMVTNNMMRLETELKNVQHNKPSGISRARTAATNRAIVIRPVTSRASRMARLEATTYKPIKVRFATIEPKSSY
uniref:Ground-like domain-containing protein n=1 Tax=Panagrellus redivivus TaxID=6233 RepID=A0A7E4UW15_PANRE